jgi:hypothetical protein
MEHGDLVNRKVLLESGALFALRGHRELRFRITRGEPEGGMRWFVTRA